MTFAERWKRIEETHPEPEPRLPWTKTDVWYEQALSRAIAQRDLLAEALEAAVSDLACADCHHSPRQYHSAEEDCPVMRDYRTILAILKPSTEVTRE